MADLTPDYSRRDCSLPLGCKDLLDVLNLPSQESAIDPEPAPLPASLPATQTSDNPKTIEIGDDISARKLATLLGCPPFKVIADMIGLQIFAANDLHLLSFEIAAKIAHKHGFKVRRGH